MTGTKPPCERHQWTMAERDGELFVFQPAVYRQCFRCQRIEHWVPPFGWAEALIGEPFDEGAIELAGVRAIERTVAAYGEPPSGWRYETTMLPVGRPLREPEFVTMPVGPQRGMSFTWGWVEVRAPRNDVLISIRLVRIG